VAYFYKNGRTTITSASPGAYDGVAVRLSTVLEVAVISQWTKGLKHEKSINHDITMVTSNYSDDNPVPQGRLRYALNCLFSLNVCSVSCPVCSIITVSKFENDKRRLLYRNERPLSERRSPAVPFVHATNSRRPVGCIICLRVFSLRPFQLPMPLLNRCTVSTPTQYTRLPYCRF